MGMQGNRLRAEDKPAASLSPRVRGALRVAAVAGLLALALHIAHGQFGVGGRALNDFVKDWIYDGIIVGAAISCLVRGWLVPDGRAAWLVLGAGLTLDATGEIYYTLAFGNAANPPTPSLADLFYLLYYPCVYVGLGLLVRQRLQRLSAATWLDGVIGATTSASVVAARLFDTIARDAVHGSPAAIATNLAYPIGDLVLLGIVIGAFALAGWRPGRAWLLLGLGLGLSAIADTAYVYANANNTYVVGDMLDSLWLASALAIGFAAWQPAPPRRPARDDSRRLLLIPGTFALVSLAVLIYGGFHHVSAEGLALAGASILAVIARAAWTFAENGRLLVRLREDSVTDSLTGLGNRRRMMGELERALDAGPDSPEAVLVMFDLDGFKLYNDAFGHLAGDTLLAHFGRRLTAAVGGAGAAYRPGGDEFCVLLHDVDHADLHVAAALAALSAEGEGFSITASHGRVAIPRETATPTQALRVADDRMYAHKGGRRGAAREQTHNVLLRLMRERQPDLHEHVRKVGRLAEMVARRMGVDEAMLADVRQAAELHDIGKAAIPESILDKPGPLSPDEWTFMRRHTILGERILAAAPALITVAGLVRSSHERWDGSGYPDGMAGESIPLGARIVAVCDAFDAMTTKRSYTRPKTPEQAIAELCRVSGAQFDPQVVETFVAAWAEMSFEPASSDRREELTRL